MLVDTKENGDDCMTDTHCHGPRKQDRFPPKFINVKDGRDGGEEHCYTHHACCEKTGSIARGAQRRKDRRCVVEDRVDAWLFLMVSAKQRISPGLRSPKGKGRRAELMFLS